MKNKKGIINKLFIIILLFSTVFTSLISCDRDYDEAEVIAAAKNLIRKSAIIEDILFGEGFSPDPLDTNSSVYKEVDTRSIELYEEKLGEKIDNFDGLRTLITKIYTPGYADNIFLGVLYGSVDSHTRYYGDKIKEQDINGKDVERNVIMVDTSYKRKKTDLVTYDYDSLKVVDVDGEKITVSINITVTKNAGTSSEKSQKKSIEVDLIEDATGWKLDTPTFAIYNEDQEKIKELENELNKR